MDNLDMSFIEESFEGNIQWTTKDDDEIDNLEALSSDDQDIRTKKII